MTTTAMIIIGVMVLFVIGSLSALKPTPHEQALDRLRTKAKEAGLTPKVVPAPEWTGHLTPQGKHGGMVGYYSIVRPELKTPLTRAPVHEKHLRVTQGDMAIDKAPWDFPGNFAVELHDGGAGAYLDEAKVLKNENFSEMQVQLNKLVDQVLGAQKKRQEEEAFLRNDKISQEDRINPVKHDL